MAEPRVVIVTGASSGIGRSTARRLAQRGDRLVLAARGVERLEAVAAECLALGAASVVARSLDVADRPSVEDLVTGTVVDLGRVDGVVHSAGIAAYGHFADVDPAVFERVLAVNLLGTANVARAALRQFRTQGGGALVLVGSLLGKIATPYMSPYLTSKWGVHGLARAIQIEARQYPGVGVSLVSPGGVDTPIYRWASTALGRHGQPPPPVDQPEQVARAIVAALERPRRESSVGLANGVSVWGFRLLPGVFDRLVTPLMSRFGLDPEAAPDGPGNAFDALPGSTETAYGEGDGPGARLVRRALNAIAALPPRSARERSGGVAAAETGYWSRDGESTPSLEENA
jgi:short-subunit dehydrogenase